MSYLELKNQKDKLRCDICGLKKAQFDKQLSKSTSYDYTEIIKKKIFEYNLIKKRMSSN